LLCILLVEPGIMEHSNFRHFQIVLWSNFTLFWSSWWTFIYWE